MGQQQVSLLGILENNPKVATAWTNLQNTMDGNGEYSKNFKKTFCDELYIAVMQTNQFTQEDEHDVYDIVKEFTNDLVNYHLEARAINRINQSVTSVQAQSGGSNGLLIFGIIMLFLFLIPGIIIIIIALSDGGNKQQVKMAQAYQGLANEFQAHYTRFMQLGDELYKDYGYSDKELMMQCQSYFNRLNDILATYTLPRMYVC